MGGWPFSSLKPISNIFFLRNTFSRLRKDPCSASSCSALCKPKDAILLIKSCFRPMYVFYSLYSSTVVHPFGKMSQRDRHSQDFQLYNVLALLKASIAGPSVVITRIAHCLAIKTCVLAHLPTCTSLLTAYSRAGDFCSSWALFDESCYKDVILWNAMITAAVENWSYDVAPCLFVEMINGGWGFDSTTLLLVLSALYHMNYLKQARSVHSLSIKAGWLWDCNLCNALVDMYGKCGDLTSSESMFAEMECRDVVSWNSIIKGCLHNSCPAKSLWYLREMVYSGQEADTVTLSCAISACTASKELVSGQVIHAWGIKVGYSTNIPLANSLVSLYSQSGYIEDSESVFGEMMDKDVVSWNAMIGGLASNGKVFETFDLLYEMQLTENARPDTVTVVTIISLCAELMLLREGRTAHVYMIRRLMASDLLVINSLIDMYSKCNSIVKAELLFNTLLERDLVSWNTMISAYSRNGHSNKAQNLFKELLHGHSEFSLSTLLAVLSSCDSPDSLQFGKSLHCWKLKSGLSNNILAVNSLMHMYIKCGDLKAAFRLLHRISAEGDISSWNTIIVGCTQNDNFQEALGTFNLMRHETTVRHDSITIVNVVAACGNLNLIFEGKSLHGLALKTFVGSDIRVQNALITMYGRCGDIESARSVFDLCSNGNLCTWNCMISAFSQNKDGRSAIQLFRSLEFEPNEITIVALLSACNQLGFLRQGKQIHGYLFHFGYHENSFISAALLDMYSNCGRLDIAYHIFTNSKEKSVAAWNSMISAYGYHNNGKKAIQLFHEMCELGVGPSKGTFISVLSACSHSGLVNEGLCFYTQMLDEYGVEPDTEHHVCMVDMLGRSGKLDEAYQFIKQMPNQPKPGVWGAMLSACNYHGNIEMGRKVAELLFELEPENVGYYISLANMYVSAGRWEDAVKFREIIQDKKLKKPAACSLIDVSSA